MEEVVPESKEKTNECRACGASPVNHTLAYLTQTADAWLNDRLLRFRSSPLHRRMDIVADRAVNASLKIVHPTLRAIGVAGFSREQHRANTYRSQVIWEEAERRGICMEQLTLFGIPLDLYRARIGATWHYFESLPIPLDLYRESYKGIDDKYLFKRLMVASGIPSPKGKRVKSLAEAELAYRELQKPLVVKPRIGSRARHTTTNINTLADLRLAFYRAKVLCREVMVEEYLEGGVCRATVVQGNLVGFLQMLPARITGNGTATIRELVDQKNRTRPERIKEVVIDDEHVEFLGRLGYTLDSVLEADKTIDLSRRTGRFEGGETREFPDEIHPKLRSYIEAAAAALRVPVVGFDVIVPDPTADPDQQRWGILEGNGLPFIDLHYLPFHGKPSNVAAAVWDLWPEAKRLGSEIVHEEQVLPMRADLVG